MGNTIAIVTDILIYILLSIDVSYMLTWMLPIVEIEPSDIGMDLYFVMCF